MWQRFTYFLVVFLLMFCRKIFSQEKPLKNPDFFSWKTISVTHVDSARINIIDPCYYSAHLTFFCKKELQIQKATMIPLRFRMGSMDYVDYLEQKPNSLKPEF